MTNGITMGNTIGVYTISASLTPAEVATVVVAHQDFTVTGIKTGDVIQVNPPAESGAVSVCAARAKAANTVTLSFVNPTAGALTPTAGTYKFTVFRPTGNSPATSIID